LKNQESLKKLLVLQLKSSCTNINEDDSEESNEPDYHEDEEQLEEKQEEETGEIASLATTNEVF
jgi:hypothetical protein